MKKRKITTLILDLGGVLFEIDHDLTKDAFKKLGAPNFANYYAHGHQHNVFDRFETGKISPEKFRVEVKNLLNIPDVSDEEFDIAWNAMLLNFPEERVQLLIDLKRDYKLFLFSNTNYIHMEAFSRTFKEKYHCELATLFDGAFFSCMCHFMKPSPASFEEIIADQKIIREETLFIDDTIRHINGAKEAKLWVHHLTKEQSILQINDFILEAEKQLEELETAEPALTWRLI